MYYSVEVTGDDFNMSDEINASNLEELAQGVREIIAYYRDGVMDTSEVDCSHIKFKYEEVIDENGNDVTKEAEAAK